LFNAKHIERQRFGARRDYAVLGNDAVLLAAADQFPCQENEKL